MNKIVGLMLVTATLLLGYGLIRSGLKTDARAPAEAAASVVTVGRLQNGQASAETRAESPSSRSALSANSSATIDDLFDDANGQRYPVRSLQSEFAALLAKMDAGDLKATRTLANALRECSEEAIGVAYSPESWAYYQAQLAEKRAAGTLSEKRYRADLAKVWNSYQVCGNVSADQRHQRRIALQKLAEAGDAKALYEFSFLGPPKDPNLPGAAQRGQSQAYVQTVERLLHQAMAQGDPHAFATVAEHYSQITIVGESRLYGIDPVKHYAYTLAAQTLRQRRLADPKRTDLDRAAEIFDSKLTDDYLYMLRPDGPGQLEKLTAEQLAAAEASATELIRACCR